MENEISSGESCLSLAIGVFLASIFIGFIEKSLLWTTTGICLGIIIVSIGLLWEINKPEGRKNEQI